MEFLPTNGSEGAGMLGCLAGNGTDAMNGSLDMMNGCIMGNAEEYPNPFQLVYIQVIFILLYGMVFMCSFIGM